MATTKDPATRLFQACDPNVSLEPTDDRYVNCDEVRGGNVVQIIERSLRRSDPERPEVKLFAGHRGVGKTSELFRLRHRLEKPATVKNDSTFEVIYFDVSRSLDVNDLDFPDLLVYTAAAVQEQLREAAIPGFDPTTTCIKRLWDDISGALGSEVHFKEASAEVPFASLSIELKNRPNSRRRLREEIERRSTDLLDAINDLLQVSLVKLIQMGKDGLVLIIDGLDKLVRRDLQEGGNTHDRLFLDRSDQLASLRAHTIYTVPISLIYTPRCTQLEQSFGEHNVPVSMINLRGEGRGEPSPGTPGMGIMREMVERRCKFAGVELAEAFEDAATHEFLCRMTGGHPRHLMMFIQAALNEMDRLPITLVAAEKAVRNYANSLFREIPLDFWNTLRQFDAPQDDIPKDDIHQEMLYLLHIFEYMNGRPWYEVNPVIRTLPKFRSA